MKDAMDTPAAVSATRRRWLYAGVAVAAAGGGAALAWRHLQPHAQEPGGEANLAMEMIVSVCNRTDISSSIPVAYCWLVSPVSSSRSMIPCCVYPNRWPTTA